jgi:radical SAM superfamily enzyme YgiQ (UPF0313 family)
MMLKALGGRDFLQHLDSTAGQSFMPQLTLPYLAALGEQYNRDFERSHEFLLFDEQEHKLVLDDMDMVWLTGGTSAVLGMYRVADRLLAKGIPVVLGGIHVSTLPEEAQAHATSLVIGEAEGVITQLLSDFDAGDGLARRYRGGHANALDGLANPAWRNANVADYCPWVVPVQTSRGCRNACSFCSTTRYQGVKRRHRPVQEIVDEIKWLKDQGILTPQKTVFFTDNNIVSDTDHRRGVRNTAYARSLFEALVPLSIHWTGQGEINVSEDPELVELMARSGCLSLLVGLETVQQKNLGSVGKVGNDVATYVRHIETLHRFGISIIGCFITGLDEDTVDVFEPTVEFIKSYVDIPQISILTPFPGTALHRQMKRENRILHQDWSKYDITHVSFRPRRMSPFELEEGYRWMTAEIYTMTEMLRRSLRHGLRPNYAQGLSRVGRVSSVFAPNLIYRRLSLVGREGAKAGLSSDYAESKVVPLNTASAERAQMKCGVA